jgi:spermidine synthase
VIASRVPYTVPELFPEGLRFLDAATAKDMFTFPPDMARLETQIQRLDDQVLVRYFDEEWSEYLIY